MKPAGSGMRIRFAHGKFVWTAAALKSVINAHRIIIPVAATKLPPAGRPTPPDNVEFDKLCPKKIVLAVGNVVTLAVALLITRLPLAEP